MYISLLPTSCPYPGYADQLLVQIVVGCLNVRFVAERAQVVEAARLLQLEIVMAEQVDVNFKIIWLFREVDDQRWGSREVQRRMSHPFYKPASLHQLCGRAIIWRETGKSSELFVAGYRALRSDSPHSMFLPSAEFAG